MLAGERVASVDGRASVVVVNDVDVAEAGYAGEVGGVGGHPLDELVNVVVAEQVKRGT